MQITISKHHTLDQDYEIEVRPITIVLGDCSTRDAEDFFIDTIVDEVRKNEKIDSNPSNGFFSNKFHFKYDDVYTLKISENKVKNGFSVFGSTTKNDEVEINIYELNSQTSSIGSVHPKAHASIAQFFVDNKDKSALNIIQTYSENMLLRFRRLIAEGVLSPSDFVIYLFENVEGKTQIQTITVDADGVLSDWQESLFTENVKEIFAMRKAVQARKNGI